MFAREATAIVRKKVLIIEDQTTIRELLVRFVTASGELAVVGHAGTVADGLRLAYETQPDVVILDWMLDNELGLDFLLKVRVDPPPYVLVFSGNVTAVAVREALAAGALGYIEKSANFDEFAAALRAVAAGKTYLGPLASRVLAEGKSSGAGRSPLSPREREILRLLALGLSSKEIAARLELSARTVENHRASLSRRTGLRSTAELTLHAVRLGLVDLGTTPGPSGP